VDRYSENIIVTCENFDETLEFFIGKLGFRLEMISPADSPNVAIISGFGKTLRLEKVDKIEPFVFNEKLLESTNEFIVTKYDAENSFQKGRAGMEYRDLIPSRLGGKFIASHIRIRMGGKVPDYVHFHKIRFQMIYCLSGWAKLVYEDQGEPFVMNKGDCVLQPPKIRHRVLECSDEFEVLEIATPAIHPTFAEHEITLPNNIFNPNRIFNGQKFVHHKAENAIWKAAENFEICDTGISVATNNLAEVWTMRATENSTFNLKHSDDFLLYFVRKGTLKLSEKYELSQNDCFVLPKDEEFVIEVNKGLELIQVRLQS
jgi:mannose-6-phosphate isomerase-like protein (cupin superfamily)